MRARLVLHLGDFKTGTTALQHWLETAPEPGRLGLLALPGAPHAGLVSSLADPADRAAHLARIGQALETAKAPRLVVSAEHFEFSDPVRLQAALAEHLPDALADLRLVAWVRPHIESYLAHFGESAKIGAFDGAPGDYLGWPPIQRRMAYANRFGRWRAVFGQRFALRLYDRARLPGGDIRRDFALAVTGTDPGPLPAAPDLNPSLGRRGLALAQAVHRAIGPLPADRTAQGARFTLGRALGRALAARPGAADDPPLTADRDLAHSLYEAFSADAAAFDAAFFPADRPMARALDATRAAAAEPAPDAARLPPETLALAQAWGRMLAEGLASPARAGALDRAFHEQPPP